MRATPMSLHMTDDLEPDDKKAQGMTVLVDEARADIYVLHAELNLIDLNKFLAPLDLADMA
jgi:hypothetical protein